MNEAVKRILPIVSALSLVMCNLDPVPNAKSANLGEETPGVPEGQFHRAGQPCLACHDDFSVGGTLYGVRGDKTPLANAELTFTDVNGKTAIATSNAAGNFWIPSAQFTLTFPLHVAVRYGTLEATMTSIIGRDGSCASCHVDPPSRISPGPVYMTQTPSLLAFATP